MRDMFILETSKDRTNYYQRKIYFQLHDVKDPGFYRAVGSFNALFHSRNHRKNITELRQFTEHDMEFVDSYRTTAPSVTVGNLYDFFDLIGFDNKTKKYASGERILKWSKKENKFK